MRMCRRREPLPYSNTPVGLNFLISGYVHSEGKIAFDPDSAIADAKFHSDGGALAYVRSFDFGGQSAKFDVIVPAASFAAQGLPERANRVSARCSISAPSAFRVSVNLFGALCLIGEGLRELPAGSDCWSRPCRSPLLWGNTTTASYSTSATIEGQSAGTWAIKGLGSMDFRSRSSVTFFSDNTDFFGGNTFSQSPIYAVQ